MSRGPGRLQTDVLDYLQTNTHDISLEGLRWTLWERKTKSATENITSAWNTSVSRAVKGLVISGKIRIELRRLESFAEATAHYPHKTLLAETRRLRLALLPILLGGIEDEELVAEYGPAANEKFFLETISPEQWRSLKESWLRLEPRLIDLLPTKKRGDRNTLFMLIAKAKAIFEPRNLSCRHSFAEYLAGCAKGQLLPEPLAREVKGFSDDLVPPPNAGHLKLKGFVHFFAYVPRHRGCTLKEATVDYLDQKCPEVVRSLPGYKPAPEVRQDRLGYVIFGRRRETHSPRLYALFDQTVFQKFHFLTLA